MRTVEQAIEAASRCLKDVGIDNPRLESEFLIAAFLRMPRARLVLNRNQLLPDPTIRGLRSWLRERQKRKPLAYVTGEQPFRDLTIKVNASVLVPRPETELVVEQALRLLDRFERFVTVVDVGTGSGNIALCLSRHARIQRVMAIDRSQAAIKVARSNESETQRGAPIQWICGDLLTPLRKEKIRVELVVANLPYVRSGEIDTLEPELQWEPRLALDGGEDGLRLIKTCIEQAKDVLLPGGFLVLEIGADQAQEITDFFGKRPGWVNIRTFRDFANLPRIVQAQRKEL